MLCALFMKTALKKIYFCVTPQMYILLKINETLLPLFSNFLKSHTLHFLLLYSNCSVSQMHSFNKSLD